MNVRRQKTWWESITVWVQEFIPGGKAVEAEKQKYRIDLNQE